MAGIAIRQCDRTCAIASRPVVRRRRSALNGSFVTGGSSVNLRALLLAGHPGSRRVRAPGARGGRRGAMSTSRWCPSKGGGGVPAMNACLDGEAVERPPFAPPFLKAGRQLIGQTPNILLFLGGRHGLAPRDSRGRLWTHQLQLTIADFVAEIHDTHHPLGGGLYYEEQKAAGAAARARVHCRIACRSSSATSSA